MYAEIDKVWVKKRIERLTVLGKFFYYTGVFKPSKSKYSKQVQLTCRKWHPLFWVLLAVYAPMSGVVGFGIYFIKAVKALFDREL